MQDIETVATTTTILYQPLARASTTAESRMNAGMRRRSSELESFGDRIP